MRCLGRTKSTRRCKLKNTKWFYPFCQYHWWQPVLLVFITIPTIVGIYAGLYRDLLEPLLSKKDVEKVEVILENKVDISEIEVQFSKESNFNILLLPFGSSQFCNDETILCERELKKILLSKDKGLEVIINYSINNKELIFAKKELEQLATKTNADLIIWGDYSKKCDFDTTLVQVNYFIPENYNTELITVGKYEVSDYHPVSNISEITNGTVIGDIENSYNWILGFKALNQKNFIEAIDYLKLVKSKESPEYAQLNHSIALAYQSLNNFEEGVKFYSKAINLDSTFHYAFNNRGNCYVNIGLFDKGLKDFNRVIQMTNGNYADAYLNRGILYRESGKKELVIEDFNKAIISWSKNNDSIDLFSLICGNRGVWICKEGHLKTGLENIRIGLDYDSNNENLILARVLCYLENGDLQNAKEIVEDLLNRNPSFLPAIALKIEILEKDNMKSEAIKLRETFRKKMNVPEGKLGLVDVWGYKIYI